MKKYNVALANDSCIFDSYDGFETLAEALEFAAGRGGKYVAHLDAGNEYKGESISLAYDPSTNRFSHYDGWQWVELQPEKIEAYIRRYI